jgi:5-methylcytosine-specific restriction enzyme A
VTISRERLLQIDKELQSLSDTLGVEIERQVLQENDSFEVSLRLVELPRPIGLCILIADDYFSWHIELKLDSFSDGLIRFMRKCLNERVDEIENLIDKTKSRNSRLSLEIDGKSNLRELGDIAWQHFSLIIARNYQSDDESMKALNDVLFDFMCILLLLLSVKIDWISSKEDEAREEGASKLSLTRKFERSRINRAICLRYHGFRCQGCGLLLQEIYGPLGANVIHVHHIVPVSKMGKSYFLDPQKDLVPLCPNCHNIVHRVDPPVPIDSLREITKYEPVKKDLV